jgi:hypothetical protein
MPSAKNTIPSGTGVPPPVTFSHERQNLIDNLAILVVRQHRSQMRGPQAESSDSPVGDKPHGLAKQRQLHT